MKLLLKKNVSNLGIIGEVVNVKVGYARNFLVPRGLAVEPTEANLKAVEADKQRYLEELAKERAAYEAKARLVQGKEITISARANEEGHLYGSIGPAQIAEALAAEKAFVDAENIVMAEPIRKLDKYDVSIKFPHDVTATIHVWVVPIREEEPAQETPPPTEG
ncbi:MAG: 50S ribosomal protein L9 [Planctomycetaceae bacterium]|nr:50S ribosomal protein L9 [Planctomycetaceae bacterium]